MAALRNLMAEGSELKDELAVLGQHMQRFLVADRRPWAEVRDCILDCMRIVRFAEIFSSNGEFFQAAAAPLSPPSGTNGCEAANAAVAAIGYALGGRCAIAPRRRYRSVGCTFMNLYKR